MTNYKQQISDHLNASVAGELDISSFLYAFISENKSEESAIRREIIIAIDEIHKEGGIIPISDYKQILGKKRNRKYSNKNIKVLNKPSDEKKDNSKKENNQPLYELVCIVAAYVCFAASWASENLYSKPYKERAAILQSRIDLMGTMIRQFQDAEEYAFSHKWHKDSTDIDLKLRDLTYNTWGPSNVIMLLNTFDSEKCDAFPVPTFTDNIITEQQEMNKVISLTESLKDAGNVSELERVCTDAKNEYDSLANKRHLYPGQNAWQNMNSYNKQSSIFSEISIFTLLAGTVLITLYKIFVWRREEN